MKENQYQSENSEQIQKQQSEEALFLERSAPSKERLTMDVEDKRSKAEEGLLES